MPSKALRKAAVKEDVRGLRKQPQHRSQSHQQDESLKVCQATFAAGKQPKLYNSAGNRGAFSPYVGRDSRDKEGT